MIIFIPPSLSKVHSPIAYVTPPTFIARHTKKCIECFFLNQANGLHLKSNPNKIPQAYVTPGMNTIRPWLCGIKDAQCVLSLI